MRKSTKVKSKKVSKTTSPKKRLKKYDDGGIQGLKKNTTFEPVVPGKTLQKTGEKTILGKEKTEVINMPTAPKTEVTEMKLKSEAVPADKILKKIEMPDASAPSAATTISAKSSTPKAKLLPGGFTSEAQKAAYIKNVKARMANGATIDQLVKERVGTKAGLEGLGLKDAVKATVVVKTKKQTTPPKNSVLSSLERKGLANTASTPLPKNSKVPLKNVTPKKENNTAEANRLKAEGLKLKSEGLKLKGQALAAKGKKQANKIVSSKEYTDSKGNKTVVNRTAGGGKQVRFDKELSWKLDESGGLNREIRTYRKNKENKVQSKEARANDLKKKQTQAERTKKFLDTGTYPMLRKGGKTTKSKLSFVKAVKKAPIKVVKSSKLKVTAKPTVMRRGGKK